MGTHHLRRKVALALRSRFHILSLICTCIRKSGPQQAGVTRLSKPRPALQVSMAFPYQVLGAWEGCTLRLLSRIQIFCVAQSFCLVYPLLTIRLLQADDWVALGISMSSSVPLFEEDIGRRLIAAQIDTGCLPLYSSHCSERLVVIIVLALTLYDFILQL